MACYNCGEIGHMKRDCSKLSPTKCYRCGETGHIRKDCPYTLSDRESRPSPSSDSEVAASGVPRRSPVKCFQCGEMGHTKRNCTYSLSSRPAASTYSTVPTSSVEFIDTHCHIEYFFERFQYQGSFEAFRSKHGPYPHNFGGCITIFCDPASFSSFRTWPDLLEEDKVWAAFGMHPHNAKYYNDSIEEKIIEALSHPRAVAWGEMGLDYAKHSPAEHDSQKRVFERQLRCAVSLDKPLVIHSRDADEDVVDIMARVVPSEWKVHLHCFTGTMDNLQRFFDVFPNLCVGFTGVVTFASARHIQECVQRVPLDRLLLETDAPYMVPTAIKKGNKFSHPAMIPYIAQKIAQLKQLPLDEILTAARRNTKKIYGI